jgi:putative ABC transport system permease protein
MNLLHLSWKNLRFKPLSTLLIIILFSLGVGLISLLLLLDHQLQKNFEKNLAGIDLVVGAKGSPLQLILCNMYHIDAPTGNISIKEAKPFLNPKHPLIEQAVPLSLGDSYRGYRIVGTTTEMLDLYGANLGEGKIWELNFEATLGANVAKALSLNIGDEFTSSHGLTEDLDMAHDHRPFKVVGILQPSGSVVDQLILTTTQSFWLVHEHQEATDSLDDHDHSHDHSGPPKSLLDEDEDHEITSLLVKFKGHSYQALNMQRNINENTDLQAATPAIEINRLYSLMNTGEQALRILAIVIIFVSGLSLFISLFNSLKERKYELALMRVMGAHPSKIFLLIIVEGLLLALIGFVVGMLLSHAGMELLAGVMEDNYRYAFTGLQILSKEWLLLASAIGVGILAAVIPAIQASRTDISETLAEG